MLSSATCLSSPQYVIGHAARSPHRSLGASITITAIGGTQGKGRDGDILAYRSHDLGKNWLGPVKVNDVDGSGREGLHAMTSEMTVPYGVSG